MTTIQDLGRQGLMFYGIPHSGAMDQQACRQANSVLGMPHENPVVEFTLIPARLEFKSDVEICLTGADMQWRINQQKIERYIKLKIKVGDILSGEHSQNGFRSYLAIQGKLECRQDYGSVATYQYAAMGGLAGKVLQQQQLLEFESMAVIRERNPTFTAVDYNSISHIQCRPGPEWEMLTALARKKLFQEPFCLSPDSNRMGARLTGTQLNLMPGSIVDSIPVMAGMIQCPPSGDLVVILQDGQTTGGYARIAMLDETELSRFNQLQPGVDFKFTYA